MKVSLENWESGSVSGTAGSKGSKDAIGTQFFLCFSSQLSFVLDSFSGGLFPCGGGWSLAAPGFHPPSSGKRFSFFNNSKQRMSLAPLEPCPFSRGMELYLARTVSCANH